MKFRRKPGSLSGIKSSPSVWRVWIEIQRDAGSHRCSARSPSVWRVWIEIPIKTEDHHRKESPSVWRVWIEILAGLQSVASAPDVTLRVEGVD